MLERVILDRLFRIRHGFLKVTYWDGSTLHYGSGGPTVPIRINDPRLVRLLWPSPSLALGDGYSQDMWDTDRQNLLDLMQILALNQADFQRWGWLNHLTPTQRNARGRQSRQVRSHYDISNRYYELLLGEVMKYSCALFPTGEETIEQAQQAMINLLINKCQLDDDMRVLDIGSGWGEFLIAMAQRYPTLTGLGITLSPPQAEYAKSRAHQAGVSDRIDFAVQNYQDLTKREQFDRIVSVGMFEHVGRRNQATFFEAVERLLKPDGLMVLHSITRDQERPILAWIDKRIFPGGHLPTVAQLHQGAAAVGLVVEHGEDFAEHYYRTLGHWFNNHGDNVEAIMTELERVMPADRAKVFYRERDIWLAMSQAGFRYFHLGLWQMVAAKDKRFNRPLTRAGYFAGVV